MREHWMYVVTIVICSVGGIALGWELNSTPPTIRPNQAMIVERMLNLDNPVCAELVTGWGFTPDTAICQAATKTGEARIPTQIVWCASGVGEPACKTIYDLRKKQ